MNARPTTVMRLSVGAFHQDVATFATYNDEELRTKVLYLGRTAGGVVLAIAADRLLGWSEYASGWQFLTQVPGATLAISGAGDNVHVCTVQSSCHFDVSVEQNHISCRFAEDSPLSNEVLDLVFASNGQNRVAGTLRFALTLTGLYDFASGSAVRLPDGITATAVAELPSGQILVGSDQGLFGYQSGRLTRLSVESDRHNAYDRLPGRIITALAADTYKNGSVSGGCWVGTPEGLAYLRGTSWLAVHGVDGLPCSDVRRLHVTKTGDLWVGTSRGAARLSKGVWQWFAGRRWLRENEVISIVSDDLDRIWIAGPNSISRIEKQTLSLTLKAQHYEQVTRSRHLRRGFVASCFLQKPGDPSTSIFEASDNDGLWTALYVAAECFRWRVSGEEEARASASESIKSLLDLVHVTGISGFPARAMISQEEREGESVIQSDPGPNWFASPTMPGVIYKNDTSSDEVDGHYLAWYLYHDLVANPAQQLEIREVCRSVTNHILDNDFTLVGPTGKTTSWGVWRPELLNHDAKWIAERGLNSLEILSHLKVAIHLCGDQRFVDAYAHLVENHGYAINTVRQKMGPPEADVNHSDDELAACAYYPLLMLEEDPALRQLYLLSLEKTHAVLRPEGSPLYNVLYGALCGRACDIDAAVTWLIDAPLDIIDWTISNREREDKRLRSDLGRFDESQFESPPRASERRVSKWNANPYAVDAGEDGTREEDGTFWLLPYWMARYHSLLEDAS